jgi:spermidine synthase
MVNNSTRDGRFLAYATIFLGAFLLFQCQPIIGRVLLPKFGGGAAVWGVCLAFFQTVLLIAYLAAHILSARWSSLSQAKVFLALLVISLFVPLRGVECTAGSLPSVAVLLTLLFSIGLPYFVLGMSSPMIQVWFRDGFEGSSPYRLYAMSNLGSLLGLLCYPFILEPFLSIDSQLWLWKGVFLLYIVAILIFSKWLTNAKTPNEEGVSSDVSGIGISVVWICLSAFASALLVVFSAYLTEDISPLPLLWVLPLSLFLVSYILTFESERWFHEPFFWWIGILALFLLSTGVVDGLLIPRIVGTLLLVFSLFVLCNGSLYELRPPAGQLTWFYFMMSVGGALGGLSVTFLAPLFFPGKEELIIVLAGAVLLLYVVRLVRSPQRSALIVRGVVGVIVVYGFWLKHADGMEKVEFVGRDFYGSHRVVREQDIVDLGTVRVLVHGTTMHGAQSLEYPQLSLGYYSESSGLGIVMKHLKAGPRKIGAIGLGSGIVASWLRDGDSLKFYEISGVVKSLAEDAFSFVRNSKGTVDILLGDGRLLLEQEPAQEYDLLVLDAFNSDSLPVHLYTFEAFEQYFRHLGSNGVLCAHVSNRYLDIKPALIRLAQEFGVPVFWISDRNPQRLFVWPSDYVIFSKNKELNEILEQKRFAGEVKPGALWRDDFYSIFSMLG